MKTKLKSLIASAAFAFLMTLPLLGLALDDVAAQSKGKERPPVTRVELEGDKPAPTPTPAPQPLRVEGAFLTELALAQSQVQQAEAALQAARLNYDLKQRQILEALGGSTADYAPVVRFDQQAQVWFFAPKPKPQAQPEAKQ